MESPYKTEQYSRQFLVPNVASIPPVYQYPVLPTGCEATSLAMLLQWAGLQHVHKETVADAIIREPCPKELPVSNHHHNGSTTTTTTTTTATATATTNNSICIRTPGGNPHRAFVGDPYDKDSFGVFHEPIAQTLEKFLGPGSALDMTAAAAAAGAGAASGSQLLQFEDVLERLQQHGAPIVVWATLELRAPRVTDRWPDCDGSGNFVEWTSPEHCMLLIGFASTKNNNNNTTTVCANGGNGDAASNRFADVDVIIVNDPHTGKVEHYDRALFQTRWEQLGRQAVTIATTAATVAAAAATTTTTPLQQHHHSCDN